MLISVIIPCYNPGIVFRETLQSLEVAANRFDIKREVIIVNDGSTDAVTLQILDELDASIYKVIHQQNKGVAAARNEGVRQSQGQYIFFLDADNKVRPDYLDDTYEILSNDASAGVAYGKPFFFGDKNAQRLFDPGPFDMHRMIQLNYIDVCSMIKKEVWNEIQGFDENREIMGHEDWDLWIRIGQTKWQFRFIDKLSYDYRIADQSLLGSNLSVAHHTKSVRYLYNKHTWLVYMSHGYLLNMRNMADLAKQIDTKPYKTLFELFRRETIHKLNRRFPVIRKIYRRL